VRDGLAEHAGAQSPREAFAEDVRLARE
jgi:hypothetical protein